jgi:hypothetical protein
MSSTPQEKGKPGDKPGGTPGHTGPGPGQDKPEDSKDQGKGRHEGGKKDERSVEQRLADLEMQNAQLRAGTAGGNVPQHGGGAYDEMAETWSQAEQEAANAGEYD